MKQGFNTPEEIRAVNQRAFDYIKEYQERFGFPPSRRDLANHLGSVPSTAQQALERLEREGVIELVPGLARGIRITGAVMKAVSDDG